MLKNKPTWSKAWFVHPRDYYKSHELMDEKPKFKVSYEKNQCPPDMNWILGWEYSRIWLKERDAHIEARRLRDNRKHISNDYKFWLNKRKPREEAQCRAQGIQKLLQAKKKKTKSDVTTIK